MTKDSKTWSYTYDANGMRTKRAYGSTVYRYVYNGSQLSQMTIGSNTLFFTYDASGMPMSVIYGGEQYFYATNLQGDVVAILNNSGVAVVEYTYDAWGNVLSTTGSLKDSLGYYNPLRYRGYVYDEETGLYYLQSRYYNPQWGRFINADGFLSTGQGLLGNNMFAYCGNNPTSRMDPLGCCYYTADGHWAHDAWEFIGEYERKPDPHTFNNKLRDVTDEVTNALILKANASVVSTMIIRDLFGDNYYTLASICYTFYQDVDHSAPWDIKRRSPWINTIGTPYPGQNATVIFDGYEIRLDKLGNLTYGFLGYAYGIPSEFLIIGSYYAAGFPTSGEYLQDELLDWEYILIGYECARTYYGG